MTKWRKYSKFQSVASYDVTIFCSQVRKLTLEGQPDEALNLITTHLLPSFATMYPTLYFQLQQQRFFKRVNAGEQLQAMELLRKELGLNCCIEFARGAHLLSGTHVALTLLPFHLLLVAPVASTHPEFTSDMKDMSLLLAFPLHHLRLSLSDNLHTITEKVSDLTPYCDLSAA
jgi:hypothetical protein